MEQNPNGKAIMEIGGASELDGGRYGWGFTMAETKRKSSANKRPRGRGGSSAKRTDRRMRALFIGLGVLLAVGIVGTWIWESASNRQISVADELDGLQTFRDEGRQHVPVGQIVQYNTEPPTSGPHYPSPVVPGFYEVRLPDEALVHNLEHGHILIWYDEDRVTDEDLEKVRALTQRYTNVWGAVVAVPRPNLETPLVLTAWTKMLKLEAFDEEKVSIFVDAYRGRGPENPIR